MAKKQKNLDDITKKFGDERQKALDNALKNIEKDFGKGAIMRLDKRTEQKGGTATSTHYHRRRKRPIRSCSQVFGTLRITWKNSYSGYSQAFGGNLLPWGLYSFVFG